MCVFFFVKIFYNTVPEVCGRECQCCGSITGVMQCLFTHLPREIHTILSNYAEKFHVCLSNHHETLTNQIIEGIQSTKIFKVIKQIFDSNR